MSEKITKVLNSQGHSGCQVVRNACEIFLSSQWLSHFQ